MWLLNEARFAIKFNFFSQPLRQRRTDGGEEEGEEAEEEEERESFNQSSEEGRQLSTVMVSFVT